MLKDLDEVVYGAGGAAAAGAAAFVAGVVDRVCAAAVATAGVGTN